MTEPTKQQIIEKIFSSLELFQKQLGSITSGAIIFSDINKLQKLEIEELKWKLSDIWQKNTESALNKYNAFISKLKIKYAYIADLKFRYNNLKRQYEALKNEKELDIWGKLGAYQLLFMDITAEIKGAEDNSDKLILEGKRSYLTIYAAIAGVVTAFYGVLVGFYFNLNIENIRQSIVSVTIIWLLILYFLWYNLYKWLNKF